ncbi:hypothetical protein FGIG_05320 [Fasciola gigantica]|uniref:C2H2-type domain-containing protein n=1 Tax=Fasciola gigantica TaxID=46835 RepID=A0A504YAG9_FASGI|nr:hypothetical protein FGIG_05320 [Fasciola gigantica]
MERYEESNGEISKQDCDGPSTTETHDSNFGSGEKEYSCDRCSKSFTTKKYLRSHLKTIHESPRLFICPLCGKQLAREKGLNQHVRTIHEGNWSVFCSICGKGFINRCRLKKHCVNVHERSSRFPCTICDKGFTSDAYRQHHMELVHCDKNPYACVACQENFSTKSALMNHVLNVHGGCDEEREAKAKLGNSPSDTSVRLPFNGFASTPDPGFPQPSSTDEQPLDLSIRKQLYSPECGKTDPSLPNNSESTQQSFAEVSSTSRGPGSTTTDNKLDDDEEYNQNKDNRTICRYGCTYCEKSFASKEYVRLHEATVHEGTKAFICSACGKHFSVHQALRKHYIIQHEGGKPYRCRDCKMEFRTRATLRSHRSTVHGQIPVCRV